MSVASEEEVEELVSALNDERPRLQSDVSDVQSTRESPLPSSGSEDEDDDNNELHIAARAGIRLLEENMHFREEVLRLKEQIAHLADEKAETLRSLEERDAQISSLLQRMRDAILDNQSVLSELSASKEQISKLQQENAAITQQLQQRSPRKRNSSRVSPRRASAVNRLLAIDTADGGVTTDDTTSGSSATATPVASPRSLSALEIDTSQSTTEEPPVETHRRQSGGDMTPSSPTRRRPTIARLREIEAKYDEEHQRCSSLRLELNFAQRRISELKPLQTQLTETNLEVHDLKEKIRQLDQQLQQSRVERAEEQELIQSLRHTVAVYEQLNDPRLRGSSADHDHRLGSSLQDGEKSTSEDHDEGVDDNNNRTKRHNDKLAQLDQAAEIINGRFRLREENERLLRQLNSLTGQVLALSSGEVDVPVDKPTPDEETGTLSRRASFGPTRQRYLEQQVSVLQELLRRFRLEWQHAHDARVGLEQEKEELLKQLDRRHTERRASSGSSAPEHVTPSSKLGKGSMDDPAEDDDDDPDAAYEQELWERTNAICEQLLSPTQSSANEEAENELLCFALLRRLVDSWTTDKPKRMKLHDWLTNALRHTGLRKPLYLNDLSSEIAMGFQTLMVPILREKFGVRLQVEKRLHNMIVTDLRIQVMEGTEGSSPLSSSSCIPLSGEVTAARLQRVHHSLLAAIDGEIEEGTCCSRGSDDFHDSVRRASRTLLGK